MAWGNRCFVLRTVRAGKVKIGGVEYRPSEHHVAYDGRLDWKRFAFGLYWSGKGIPHMKDGKQMIFLWGTEEQYGYQGADWESRRFEEPHLVDGAYPWECWV